MNDKAIDLYNEGYFYYSGSNGYPLNYKRAYEYFQQSAAMGYGDAINYLGCMHLDGTGVEKNIALAIEWFKKGVKAQNHWAMYNLGNLYYTGDGVPQNEKLAMQLFRQSYDTGKNPNAAYYVGYDLMEQKKYLDAAKLFQYSAKETNIPEAWYNLGVLFMNGNIKKSGETNNQSAYACFVKAADQGLVEAMYNCGRILLREQREKEGDLWLYRAAQAGYGPAKKLLKARDVAKYGISGLF